MPDRDRELEDFVAACAALRAAKTRPSPILLSLKAAGWYDLDGAPLAPQKWEDGSLAGFELHIPDNSDDVIAIRIDRNTKQCMVRRQKRANTDRMPQAAAG